MLTTARSSRERLVEIQSRKYSSENGFGKRWVLSRWRKLADVTSFGRSFHVRRPTTGKARLVTVVTLTLNTAWRLVPAEKRSRRSSVDQGMRLGDSSRAKLKRQHTLWDFGEDMLIQTLSNFFFSLDNPPSPFRFSFRFSSFFIGAGAAFPAGFLWTQIRAKRSACRT